MITLALESAAAVASVALTEDGRTLAELTLDNGNTHSETLLPMADMLFRLTGRTLADVDLFAVSVGPGSFTGIRIGAATVKGLAFGSGKCCLGVSSLEALAYGLRRAPCGLCRTRPLCRGRFPPCNRCRHTRGRNGCRAAVAGFCGGGGICGRGGICARRTWVGRNALPRLSPPLSGGTRTAGTFEKLIFYPKGNTIS